jgi:hypothetical protein
MRNSQILAEIAIAKEKHLKKRRTRNHAEQIISTRRRPATQVFPTGRDSSGHVIPILWRGPAFQILPSVYFQDGVDTDALWDDQLLNFRLPTAAEMDTIIAVNLKLFQLQPEVSMDSEHDGIEDVTWQMDDPGDLKLEEVKIGRLNDNNFNVDECPPDMSQKHYSLQSSVLIAYGSGIRADIDFWMEIVGETFNSEISVKGEVPSYLEASYLEPDRINKRIIKPALNRIIALQNDCGCSIKNDQIKWFKHWAARAVELYDNRAFIEFHTSLRYPRYR